jgi:hypothetical protein
VLVELSVMEQRYQAVLAVVQDGWKVVEVADRLGVSGKPSTPGSPVTKRAACQPSPTVPTDRPPVLTRSLRGPRR